MKINIHKENEQRPSEKNCHHPSLKEENDGAKVCTICGRVVYSGNNSYQSNSDSNENGSSFSQNRQ